MCSASAPRSASLPTVTGSDVASRSASCWPNGTSTQPRFGANRTRPSECRTTPQTPAPIPTQTASSSAPASTDLVSRSTCRRMLRRLVTHPGTAGPRDGPAPPRPDPPGPRSGGRRRRPWRARTPARTPGRTTIDGRPAPPRPTGARSWTSPASARSDVSAPTVLRFSPVSAVRSDRDVAPLTCSRRSRLPRLCRRTSSWVAPASVVAIARARGRPRQTRPVEADRRRVIASTLAASSSTRAVTMYIDRRTSAGAGPAVADDRDDETADDRVDDPALATEQAGAADDGRRDATAAGSANPRSGMSRRCPGWR